MMFAHIHSTKEKLYGLFNLHVQLDFTIGDLNTVAKSPLIILATKNIPGEVSAVVIQFKTIKIGSNTVYYLQ